MSLYYDRNIKESEFFSIDRRRGEARTPRRWPGGLWLDTVTIASRFAETAVEASVTVPPDLHWGRTIGRDWTPWVTIASRPSRRPRTQPPAAPQTAGAVSSIRTQRSIRKVFAGALAPDAGVDE